jgi:hypothetical protein
MEQVFHQYRSRVDGSKILDYEGNWRDMLKLRKHLHSAAGFIDGMGFISFPKHAFDGYNPYRVTKSGFDWEVVKRTWSGCGRSSNYLFVEVP